MFKLVIQDDEGKTTVVPLIRDEITIGRKEGNTIRLTERNVSRRHARIVRNNGEVQIEDLGSYNGIRVNNARIAERVALRISDQVQIGDYKLYLKAEGVEQVDDQRTMPIERVDSPLPTEVMPAVNTQPTQPMAAPAMPVNGIPGTPAPNRSQAAVADTDPSGRPVATAAQVAALTQPVGYGKLVVISSNFAGKELDLTRPQMIVGRTDENDLVINHRSISRNHAKVTRDPESGRYTISDLQSSNGVRVNGQDYGKVELRRGDTVDLGHVRLRFVEPGEDFVFARDAVIADIPETGGRRGLLVAVILGVLVLGGVGAFFALSKKDTGSQAQAGSGTNGQIDNGSGSEMVAVANGSDTTNNGSDTQGLSNPRPDVPADAAEAVKPDDVAGQLKVECGQFGVEKKWTDAINCADRLTKHDPATAKKLKTAYKSELENELTKSRLEEAIRDKSYARAKKELAQIEDESVYQKEAQRLFDTFEDNVVAMYRDNAASLKKSNRCADIDRLAVEARDKGGAKAVAAVASQKCEKVATVPDKPDCSDKLVDGSAACKKQFCAANPKDEKCGGGSGGGSGGSGGGTQVTAPANCDPEAAKEKGMQNINMGQHAAALAQFEAALRCKPDPYVYELAFMESCASGNSPKAKQYYKKLPPAKQTRLSQICIRQKPPVAFE
jgi:ABC transport system ATP-binding/permease protein